MKVYPRTHGETCWTTGVAPDQSSGLSPHTRGNRFGHVLDLLNASRGSIPAHTGKPSTRATRGCTCKVYPRTHGETRLQGGDACGVWGLSPHTRGNQSVRVQAADSIRSIPAHTGKPFFDLGFFGSQGVYPRTHGETGRPAAVRIPDGGLSPHTRGNHGVDLYHVQ